MVVFREGKNFPSQNMTILRGKLFSLANLTEIGGKIPANFPPFCEGKKYPSQNWRNLGGKFPPNSSHFAREQFFPRKIWPFWEGKLFPSQKWSFLRGKLFSLTKIVLCRNIISAFRLWFWILQAFLFARLPCSSPFDLRWPCSEFFGFFAFGGRSPSIYDFFTFGGHYPSSFLFVLDSSAFCL